MGHRNRCICEFPPTCGGFGAVFCDGCGGDFCVCTCGGEMACDCDMCRDDCELDDYLGELPDGFDFPDDSEDQLPQASVKTSSSGVEWTSDN